MADAEYQETNHGAFVITSESFVGLPEVKLSMQSDWLYVAVLIGLGLGPLLGVIMSPS